ncbi:MAG: hypothetical protein IPG04_24400 [Polyangiaceae bacterium]|nr:hypothetical protein [Polyangiaceae bacterium]
MNQRSAIPGAIGVAASVLGGAAAIISTRDYARHLDRQLHGTQCSFIPGLGEATADNACTAALQSPYSALLKDRYWGGIPISLFALGAFSFTCALALYLLVGRASASKRTRLAYFLVALGPLVASLVMLGISATKLGQFCKTCVAIYVASAGLFVSGILALVTTRTPFGAVPRPAPPPQPPRSADPDATQLDPEPWHQKTGPSNRPYPIPKTVVDTPAPSGLPVGSWAAPVGILAAMATATAVPAVVYAGTMPDFRGKITGCGELKKPETVSDVLVKIKTTGAVQPALSVEDPLCPNCKVFHERLVSEGVYERLDLHVVIFPLDSECNWMLKKSMHPGACQLAKAFLCAEKDGNPREVLEWSYDNQEELAAAGKSDPKELRKKIKGRFPSLDMCIDAKETDKRLESVLRFAIDNDLRVSTPQLFLGKSYSRVCPEDTDIGLAYAVRHLAPAAAAKD